MKSGLILFLLILLCSCGKSPSEETDEAIDIANSYIDGSECQKAIDILEKVGRTNANAIYLQTLASAYACRAGFSEITFIKTDVPLISTTATELFKSLSVLSFSHETVADSSKYADVKEALNIILNSTGPQPSHLAREAKFGTFKSGDLGTQSLFMSLAQLGRYLHYYGNVNTTTGKKGGGPKSSTCFVKYNATKAVLFIANNGGGVCTSSSAGHPDLTLLTDLTVTKRRMCEGLMLMTNVIDLLNNMDLPSNESLGNLSQVTTIVNDLENTIHTADPALGTLMSTTSQAKCEEYVATTAGFDELQLLYAILFESGLSGVP